MSEEAPARKSRRADVDWEAIKRDFRIGQLTAREIGRQHNIDASSITRRAKKEGWEKDLTHEVKTRTRAALLRNDPPECATDRNTATREDLDLAVKTNVELVRQHRSRLSFLNNIVETLSRQLEISASQRDAIEDAILEETAGDKNGERRARMLKAVSLPSHAAVVRELSQALKNVIPLERQAFNLEDDSRAPPGAAPEIDESMTPQQAAEAYARTVSGG